MVYSQRILLALTERGMTRTKAYEAVQKAALDAFSEGASFKERIAQDQNVREVLSDKELEELFSWGPYLKHVDTVYERCLGPSIKD
jgi:adenylosuccinate lyase